MRTTRERQDLWHPGAFVGDTGAASGLLQLAWTEQAFARGYSPGDLALLHASVPSGSRAAAVITR
jgi:3-oxoacyl-[acyl-carrier-protein] synthase-1